MAKSGRALWTAAIKEGKKSSPAGASERTEKSADSRARKKRLETERKLRGRQMCGRVLGIDPSLRGTGLAVLEAREDGTLVYIESLTVKNRPTLSMPECLARILEETDGIIRRNKPDCVAIEQSVYVQNFRTALILGSSRGAAIAAAAAKKARSLRVSAAENQAGGNRLRQGEQRADCAFGGGSRLERAPCFRPTRRTRRARR